VSREAHIALLRRNPLFAPLPLTALDRLAEGLLPVSFDEGDVLMRKGEVGDRYLVIGSGEVEACDDELVLGRCRPGDGVGEIALIRSVPRTATVRALTHVDGYEIDPATFLSALAGPAGTAAAAAVTAARLRNSPTR
jgi:CRP-like cAMP-binding protein